MNLTLVISSLSAGGAERIISILANYWATKGWNVSLLTLDNGAKPPFYKLNPEVKHISLGIMKASRSSLTALINNIARIQVVRKAIINNKAHVVISFLTELNIITILATRFMAVPVIISERVDPKYHFPGAIWWLLRRLLYPFADCIVVQTAAVADYFSNLASGKLRIIPNPVLPPNPKRYRQCESSTSIVTAGRLTTQKRFDVLIKAFAQICNKHPGWTVTILGEGELRSELESLVRDLCLTTRVLLPGIQDVDEYFQGAELFVLSSDYEGFPNVLCEAMASGLPVIATACSSGPKEIINHGVNGILVPPNNVDALASALDELIFDQGKRKALGSQASKITQIYGLETIMSMWEEVIEQSMLKRGNIRANVDADKLKNIA